MRSYGQYCALAKALDVVGDRWTLLIVRELLLRGACRYTDLRNGLPGIATNLLADRLRELEAAGLISREQAPPPVAATLFRLTERGEQLEPALEALGRWGVPLMVEHDPDEEFRSHWMAMPVELFLSDHAPERPGVSIELRTGSEPVVLETAEGRVQMRPAGAESTDATLTGEPWQVLGVLSGQVPLVEAQADGLRFEGDPEVLARVIGEPSDVPAAPATPAPDRPS